MKSRTLHAASGAPPNPLREVSATAKAYGAVRRQSEALCATLETEDFVVQSMPDVSPTRWHLAHTTWFFEQFVLKRANPQRIPSHPQFDYLFNSYYNAVGAQFPRPQRGLLTRPTVKEVFAYRAAIDDEMAALFESSVVEDPVLQRIIETGLHHEQQHQELMLTDIKHVLSCNPLAPALTSPPPPNTAPAPPLQWLRYKGGRVSLGHAGDGFCYDNETPRHDVLVQPFELAHRLVTNAEFLAFIEDGGYRRPELWLSDGWATVQAEQWQQPLYWRNVDGAWHEFTLGGLVSLDPQTPVSHLSYYEADAFARWREVRLPTEAEWETAARGVKLAGNFVESGRWHPAPQRPPAVDDRPVQMFGDVWEWTSSPYTPYPGFAAAAGALGEYNGKFMCNQMVLRGGSCASPQSHLRVTYRNFFHPPAQWQFAGIRLAR